MKTAKEIAKDIVANDYGQITCDEQYNREVEIVERYLNNYAREACKEQREICANKAKLGRTGVGISLDSIKNAPEPELK